MGFSNLFGLIGLIGIPILVILYMLRPKNKPLNIPSLYLWQALKEELESASKIKKLKSSVLMFLQIGTVLLLTGILAGLFIKDKNNSDQVLLVVDCSYTMESTDVEGTRLELAKSYVETYVKGLSDGTTMTLVALEEVPRVVLSAVTDKNLLVTAVKDLESIDGIGDLEIAKEAIQLIRKPNDLVVYFGDRSITGAISYQTVNESKNYSVHEITYTKYPEQGTLSALVPIYNHDVEATVIPVSLYVDGLFFASKQISVDSESTGKLFFEDIPIQTQVLKVQIDTMDQLLIDNTATAIVTEALTKKALLITTSNIFLEKVLRLYPNLELTIASVDDGSSNRTYSGYDLYIMDRIFPSELPSDGAMILIDPIDRKETPSEGFVEYPKFKTHQHPITKHIEAPEFSVRVASVFNDIDPSRIIYETEFGTTAYTTEINGADTLVFGFNLQDTDLPLSVEFPVLFMNCLDYLLDKSLVDQSSHFIGEQVVITILPSATKVTVTDPNGNTFNLDVSKNEYVFTQASQVGIYQVEEETPSGLVKDAFTLNTPVAIGEKTSIEENDRTSDLALSKSLDMILGLAAIALICLEWILFSYRRKIHGNTF